MADVHPAERERIGATVDVDAVLRRLEDAAPFAPNGRLLALAAIAIRSLRRQPAAESGFSDEDIATWKNFGAPTMNEMLFALESFKRMCNRLQECVQRHGLGLGGEHIDRLVCDEVDRLRAPTEKPSADERQQEGSEE